MIVTNEQLSTALLQTPNILSTALNDASIFIRNTNAQLHHVTQKSLDRTLGQIYSDLEGNVYHFTLYPYINNEVSVA